MTQQPTNEILSYLTYLRICIILSNECNASSMDMDEMNRTSFPCYSAHFPCGRFAKFVWSIFHVESDEAEYWRRILAFFGVVLVLCFSLFRQK